MASLREQLDAASEEFGRALDNAGDELKSGVQSASSKLTRLIDDVEDDVEGAGDRVGEVADDLIGRIDEMLETADEETSRHLRNARERLTEAREESE